MQPVFDFAQLPGATSRRLSVVGSVFAVAPLVAAKRQFVVIAALTGPQCGATGGDLLKVTMKPCTENAPILKVGTVFMFTGSYTTPKAQFTSKYVQYQTFEADSVSGFKSDLWTVRPAEFWVDSLLSKPVRNSNHYTMRTTEGIVQLRARDGSDAIHPKVMATWMNEAMPVIFVGASRTTMPEGYVFLWPASEPEVQHLLTIQPAAVEAPLTAEYQEFMVPAETHAAWGPRKSSAPGTSAAPTTTPGAPTATPGAAAAAAVPNPLQFFNFLQQMMQAQPALALQLQAGAVPQLTCELTSVVPPPPPPPSPLLMSAEQTPTPEPATQPLLAVPQTAAQPQNKTIPIGAHLDKLATQQSPPNVLPQSCDRKRPREE